MEYGYVPTEVVAICIGLLVAEVRLVILPSKIEFPTTVRLCAGVLVPIPTLPSAVFTNKAGLVPVAIFKFPQTSSLAEGEEVPIPTFPEIEFREEDNKSKACLSA